MPIKIIFMLLLSYNVSAETLCTEKMKNLHHTVKTTCDMYEEVDSQRVDYIPNNGDIDYSTETSHKLYLQSQFFQGSVDTGLLKEHFGYYEKLKTINVDEDDTLRVLSAPLGVGSPDLYCDASFDLFTPLAFTDRNGQKKEVLNFLDKSKDVVSQLKELRNNMNVDRVNNSVPLGINKSFDLYCGKLKTNEQVTYSWDSPECYETKKYQEEGGNNNIKHELASGNIYIRNVYVGSGETPRKVCVINYKKEIEYESSCRLQQGDILLTEGETPESKMVQLKEKYTAEGCCGEYPNAYLYIQNPFNIIFKNSNGRDDVNTLVGDLFGKLNLESKIKCVINKRSSGYETKHLVEKEIEPTIKQPFDIGCGGITYTGVYEQNVIDRLNNYKEILNEVASPYTKCCDEDSLSNIQKYGYIYAVSQCTTELTEMVTLGTYNGVKVSDSLSEAITSCGRHFSDTSVKAGGMGNSSLGNVGGRITQGLSGAQNYVGCLSEEINDMEIIKKFKGCVDSNYEDFMDFINWLVSQQLTLNIGMDRFMGEVCRDELDKSSSIDLSFNLEDFTGSAGISSSEDLESSQNAEELKDTLRIEEGGNYYGVIKEGNQYLPALTLQDKHAFQTTNLSRPFGGLDSKEHPTFLYAELHDLLGLSYNIPGITDKMSSVLGCKQGAFDNIRELINRKLKTIKEMKTIDGYVYMYANNAKLLSIGEIKDIGIFTNLECQSSQKEEILEFFNLALGKYIKLYLSNKVNTLKEAELGLIKQELIQPVQYSYSSGYSDHMGSGYVGDEYSKIEPTLYDEKLVVPDPKDYESVDQFILDTNNLIKRERKQIESLKSNIDAHFQAKLAYCRRKPTTKEYNACIKITDHNILRMGRELGELALDIAEQKQTMIKHSLGSPTTETADSPNYTEEEMAAKGMTFIAQEFVGIPYVWAGEDPSGFDCSGLTQYLYRQKGINIPRQAQKQFYSPKGISVRMKDLRPGDLVFFHTDSSRGLEITHVGMFTGETNNMIHARGRDYGIQTVPFDDYLRNKRDGFYRGAVRFLKSNNAPSRSTVQAYPQTQYGQMVNQAVPNNIGYDEEKYKEVVEKYAKEDSDKANPMYIKKKSLEIYQSIKRNKEIKYFKNIDLLKKSIGVF